MADYNEDLSFLNELYTATKATADKKTEKNNAADIEQEEEEMGRLSTGLAILSEHRDTEQSGMVRDTSEIAAGNQVFTDLKAILSASSRSSGSKYMRPVVSALDDYLAEDGISVRTAAFLRARTTADNAEKEAAKKAAIDEAFAEITAQVSEKMQNFVTAANNYATERDSNTGKPWTKEGKRRRAMVRAACIQMEDQIKSFEAGKESLRDNIGILLEFADSQGQSTLKLSANVMVRDLFEEAGRKANAAEIEMMAKEIANRIAMDQTLQEGGTAQFEQVASLLNQGISEENRILFDPVRLFREYQVLRAKTPQNLAATSQSLILMNGLKAKNFTVEQAAGLDQQKGKISAMYYLLTGSDRLPDFTSYWEIIKPTTARDEEQIRIREKRVFPIGNIPKLTLGAEMGAEDFVKKIKTAYGENALDGVDYMKYVDGQATANAGLEKSDDAIWKDLGKAISGKEGEGLDEASTVRVRYLALQKALGKLAPLPAQEENAPANNAFEELD